MEIIKKLFSKKILFIILPAVVSIVGFFVIIVAVIGFVTGESLVEERTNSMREKSSVINSQLYAERYKGLLNKYLTTKGYVSLERMVFYLQRTNNVLDTSTLSLEQWDKAYLSNVNEKEKQMIPIKTICKNLSTDTSLPDFNIESGTNSDGVSIDVIDLCNKDGIDITLSSEYDESYYPLPFSFPLRRDFTITSIVFEHRNVNLGLSDSAQERINFHSGWDLAVPIGTNFYSVCDGTVTNITNTQANDLPFSESNNSTGNYMIVKCNNGLSAQYFHLQHNSQPYILRVGSLVRKGDLLGRTSTTGQSTGPHLHLGLKADDDTLLDIMAYIDFTKYEED